MHKAIPAKDAFLESGHHMMTLNVQNKSWTLLGQILQWVAVMGDCQGTGSKFKCMERDCQSLMCLMLEEM